MTDEAGRMAALAIRVAEDKKAADMVLLNIGEVSIVADYFLILTGASKVQVQAIADHIITNMKEEGYPLLSKEGYHEGQWLLLDYGSLVVHIFQPEQRSFYNLERLWNHAPRVRVAG